MSVTCEAQDEPERPRSRGGRVHWLTHAQAFVRQGLSGDYVYRDCQAGKGLANVKACDAGVFRLRSSGGGTA